MCLRPHLPSQQHHLQEGDSWKTCGTKKVTALEADSFDGAATLNGCLNEQRGYKVHSSFGGWKFNVCWFAYTKGLAETMLDFFLDEVLLRLQNMSNPSSSVVCVRLKLLQLHPGRPPALFRHDPGCSDQLLERLRPHLTEANSHTRTYTHRNTHKRLKKKDTS